MGTECKDIMSHLNDLREGILTFSQFAWPVHKQ